MTTPKHVPSMRIQNRRRSQRAYVLQQQGTSYTKIADALDYTDAAAALRAVRTHLAHLAQEAAVR